ncbi:hypothetical protein QQS21_002612 [Conoideocrella luteorostrata]|uniref:Cyanovirin-N domain-containing protein n=1 Tax=Conoideocrella luteorostrata TaxID=1105319 RepID=A0AAJ0G191_9HYPO|nr:hypothetical protein QQS21_002612 [Conoideocrella luteorostrata]
MKCTIFSIVAMAAAAIATATPGSYGNGERLEHVYCTDEHDSIIDIKVDIELSDRIKQCSRGLGLGLELKLDIDIDIDIREDADKFCRDHDRVHGVWGCSKPCHGEIDYDHCTRCDHGEY